MFNFLCKNLVSQKRGLLIIGSTPTILSVLQTPSLNRITARSISTTNNNNAFTVSYLIDSCGLSQQQALSASKKVQFKTPSKPDSVLALLKNYGFTNTHISKFVLGFPSLLVANPHKSLQPKFEFFRSFGISDPDIAKLISTDPQVLSFSLEKQIIPCFDFLKGIVDTNTNVIRILKNSTWILKEDPHKHITPNIACLQAHGVPDSNISMALRITTRMFLKSTDPFNAACNEIKEMGFDPLKFLFVMGVNVLISTTKSVREVKMEVFKKWGWSEREIQMAFLKQPYCMKASEKKLMNTMDFLVHKMGYDPSLIAKDPDVLLLSLEKRIIPRSSVIRVLKLNCLLKKDYSFGNMFKTSDKDFLKNFVLKFEDKVPELLNVYQGKVNAVELPTKSEGVV